MKCESNNLNPKGGFSDCENEAAHTLWCPTWVSAAKGPVRFCHEHAEVFQPEHNQNAGGGWFFWGDEAHEAFGECGEIISRDDDRYSGATGMAYNGTKLDWHGPSTCWARGQDVGWYVVDGQVWLVTGLTAVHAGRYDEALQRYGQAVPA